MAKEVVPHRATFMYTEKDNEGHCPNVHLAWTQLMTKIPSQGSGGSLRFDGSSPLFEATSMRMQPKLDRTPVYTY